MPVSASLPGLRTQAQQTSRSKRMLRRVVDFVMQALQLEAVTVTAMLREQRLADVPFSIAAPTEQALRIAARTTSRRLRPIAISRIQTVPCQPRSCGQSQAAIRGGLLGSDRARTSPE